MDQLGVKPQINGRYDLTEVEPLDHSMSRTYRDHQIRIFGKCILMHTKETHFYLTDILHKLILTNY